MNELPRGKTPEVSAIGPYGVDWDFDLAPPAYRGISIRFRVLMTAD